MATTEVPILSASPEDIPPNVHEFYFAGGLITFFSSTFILGTYALIPSLRRYPAQLVFWRSICNVFFSLQFMVVLYNRDSVEQHCEFWSPFLQFSLLASQTWFFCGTIDLWRGLRNPFTSNEAMLPYYHLAAWGLSGTTALITYGIVESVGDRGQSSYRREFQLCWIPENATDNDAPNIFSWMFFFIPTVAYMISGLVVVFYAHYRLRKGLSETFRMRREVLRAGRFSTATFTLYWTFQAVLYVILFYSNPEDKNDEGVLKCFCLFMGSMGALDIIVWCYNHRVIGAIRNWRAGVSVDHGGHGINRALRREMLIYTTDGMIESLKMSHEKGFRNSFNGAMPPAKAYARDTDAGDGVQIFLRRKNFEDIKKRGKELVPFTDFKPRVFAFLREKMGISASEYMQSISGYEAASKGEFSGRQPEMVEKFSEGKSGSFFYFSRDRRYIVKTVTKDEAHFLLRFLQQYVEYMSQHPDTLINKFCGLHSIHMYNTTVYFVVMESIFLTTKSIDERYDIKGSWVARSTNYKDSRSAGVMKDSDLHKKLLLSESQRSTFLETMRMDSTFLASVGIMDYSLLIGIHYVRRRAFTHAQEVERKRMSTLNLENMSPPMSPASSPPAPYGGDTGIGAQDIQLSGLSPTSPRSPSRSRVLNDYYGGLQAKVIEGPGVYFLGVIDILQEWNFSKRIERFFKTTFMGRDPKGVSCIEPTAYAMRFQRALADITEAVSENDRSRAVSADFSNDDIGIPVSPPLIAEASVNTIYESAKLNRRSTLVDVQDPEDGSN